MADELPVTKWQISHVGAVSAILDLPNYIEYAEFVMENGTNLNVADVHQRSCDSYGVVTLGQGHGLLGAWARFCPRGADYECPTWAHYVKNGSLPGIFF